MSNVLRLLIAYIALLILCTGCAEPVGMCYDSDDDGFFATIVVPAHPPQKHRMQNVAPAIQVVEWIDTGQYVTAGGDNGILAGKVYGYWQPWGSINSATCGAAPCTNIQTTTQNSSGLPPNSSGLISPCITTLAGAGQSVTLQRLTKSVQPSATGNCSLTNGIGLYGLIAMTDGINGYSDPNKTNGISYAPTSFNIDDPFRTFHIGEYTSETTANKFSLNHTVYCTPSNDYSTYTCNKDVIQDGNHTGAPTIVAGRLFLKILDNYYDDNLGQYTVRFTQGVFSIGFIMNLMIFLKDTFGTVSKMSYNIVIKNITPVIRGIMIIYLAITGAMFAAGIVHITQGELAKRIVKIVMIAMLISNTSYNFFNDHLFQIFSAVPNVIAKSIVDSAFNIKSTTLLINHKAMLQQVSSANIPAGLGWLVLYDNFLRSFFSKVVGSKMVALLFTQYFFYIPLFYLCVIIMTIVIFKAIILYIMALLMFSILIIIFPIFLVPILFERTKYLFDNWLRSISSCALLTIITTMVVALMLCFFSADYVKLLDYGVCITSYDFLSILNLSYWAPSDHSEVAAAMDIITYLKMLFIVLIFSQLVTQIPAIVDSIAGNMATARMESGFQYAINKAGGLAKSMMHYGSPMNIADTAIGGTMGVFSKDFAAKYRPRAWGEAVDDKFKKLQKKIEDTTVGKYLLAPTKRVFDRAWGAGKIGYHAVSGVLDSLQHGDNTQYNGYKQAINNYVGLKRSQHDQINDAFTREHDRKADDLKQKYIEQVRAERIAREEYERTTAAREAAQLALTNNNDQAQIPGLQNALTQAKKDHNMAEAAYNVAQGNLTKTKQDMVSMKEKYAKKYKSMVQSQGKDQLFGISRSSYGSGYSANAINNFQEHQEKVFRNVVDAFQNLHNP